MKSKDIKNLDDLITFMDAEAKRWKRENHDSSCVHGRGIKKQWEEAVKEGKYPAPIYFMESIMKDEKNARFEIKCAWFTKGGTITSKPKQKLDELRRKAGVK